MIELLLASMISMSTITLMKTLKKFVLNVRILKIQGKIRYKNLFKGNQLCISNTSFRMQHVKELHERGLVAHAGRG